MAAPEARDAFSNHAEGRVSHDESGRITCFCLDVLGADDYLWWVKAAGESDFTRRAKTSNSAALLTLPSGAAEVQVSASNSSGEGARSAVVAVTVP